MKNLRLLPVLCLLFCCSCSVNTQVMPSQALTEAQILEEIKNLPKINAPVIEQHRFKQLEFSSKITKDVTKFTEQYNFEYYADGKIKNVRNRSNEVIYNFDYKNNILITNAFQGINSLVLDSNGAVLTNQGEQNKDRFYFKDGFLLKAFGNIALNRTYSPDGNLLSSEGDKISYEYTNLPNTIRQEVTGYKVLDIKFRDSFLGKYSTNLVKKAIIGPYTLYFIYEFDSQKRVTKATVERISGFPAGTLTVTGSGGVEGDSIYEYVFTY